MYINLYHLRSIWIHMDTSVFIDVFSIITMPNGRGLKLISGPTSSKDFFRFSLWCRKNPKGSQNWETHHVRTCFCFEQMGVSQTVVSHTHNSYSLLKWRINVGVYMCLLPLDLGKKQLHHVQTKPPFSLEKKHIRSEARVESSRASPCVVTIRRSSMSSRMIPARGFPVDQCRLQNCQLGMEDWEDQPSILIPH